MKLNAVEKYLMNNPIRAAVQRHYEAPLLERIGGRLDGMRVLEIGCGRGVGTEILLNRFGAAFVHAVDIDPDMVGLAQNRLARYIPERVKVEVADATQIPVTDNAFDAVVDFGIIHHIPVWQDAIPEIVRVLKPGGRFIFEEVTKHALDRWFYRTFLEHPKENRFSAEEFVAALEEHGIAVEGNVTTWFFGDFVIGAGTRTAA